MVSERPDGVAIDVRVIPRAGRSGIAGTREGALLVRLNAPPVDNAANDELIEVIADAIGVSKRTVTITSGQTSRRKTLLVTGASAETVRAKLGSV